MAKGYRPVDRDQQFLLPPDMREWLPASDPVWLVIELIGACDTSAFHVGRRVGGAGRAGFDPDMLVVLVVWAWLNGVRSSRQIERLCGRDVGFRVICAGDVPDHVTVARFRQGFSAGVEQLFEQVLVVAHRLGLGQLGVVALDGTKIASPASSGQNRTEEGLAKAAAAEQARQAAREAAREAAKAHAEADTAEDARFGPWAHGDQMGPDPATAPAADTPAADTPAADTPAADTPAADTPAAGAPAAAPAADASGPDPRSSGAGAVVVAPGRSRAVRIAEAIADLQQQADREQAEQQRAAVARTSPGWRSKGGRAPAGTEVMLAEQALAAVRAAAQDRLRAWEQTGRGRRPPEVDQHWLVRKADARLARAHALTAARAARPARRAPVRNITDPQSRPQPLAGGSWLQGYNAQAITTDDGLIWATSVSNNPADQTTFITMMQQATTTAERLNAGPIGIIVADAGYLSIDNLTADGPDRIIAVGTRRNLETAAHTSPQAADPPTRPHTHPTIQTMRDRLATPEGIATYRQRGRIAETTFGHAKHNLNFRQFTGIGLDRANTEWQFHATVHNLTKIINHRLTHPNPTH